MQRIEIKYISSKPKNSKGNKIRANQTFTEYIRFKEDKFKDQQDAYKYYKNLYSNVFAVKLTQYES